MDREKRSLLVVDSSATYLFYMAMLLKKMDYTVRTATTAEHALQSLIDPLPSLVITATSFPGMSGMDMLQQMKNNPKLKSIPVIIHTSGINAAAREACMAAGCAAFFKKPADPDTLYRAIQSATESIPRQNIRIEVSLNVEIVSKTMGRESSRKEIVTTLSEGGLYISTLTPEPVDAVLPLKLNLRNKEIRATVVVLYSSVKIGGPHKVPGMGVRFVNINPDDRTLVHDFIQEQVTKDLALPSK
jgi:two-component system cell cycle response regulator DivK